MLEQLTDIGFAFAVLAFIGFLLNDAFNAGKYLDIPIIKRSSLEIIFHYCSKAVFALSIIIGLVYPFIRSNSDLQLDPSSLYTVTVLFGVSIFYIIAYFVAFFAGIYDRYASYRSVYVIYECCGAKVREKFPSVLTVDDDYVFFEKYKTNSWKCIPKRSILQMETVIEQNTRYRLAIINKFAWVIRYNVYIKIALIVLMLVYFITLPFGFLPLTIILAILILICGILL
nr:hypothetical protein [uncultured Methanoregula sp.]